MSRAASIRPEAPAIARNTPTLVNAALQPAQFMDERSVTLEDQVLVVLRSPAEMASSPEQAAMNLSTDAGTSAMFARAFHDADRPVSALRVRQALAAYVRSLVSLDSRFDRAVRPGGDTTLLDADERRGFTLFMGKARCGTCHFAPLFNGTSPPLYMSSDLEVIGTSVTAQPMTWSIPIRACAHRSSPDSSSRVQDAVPSQRGVDRAVHAQRRVPIAG